MDATDTNTNPTPVPNTQSPRWFSSLRNRIDPQNATNRSLLTDRWFQQAMTSGLDVEQADSDQSPEYRTSQDVSMQPSDTTRASSGDY